MSRGGFRGGRGGGGPQSGAMQLVSFDLLKDLGSGSLFNVQTALFPPADVPMPRKPTETESREWQLRDECLKMIRTTPFHFVPPPSAPDIERYSDKYKQKKEKRGLNDISTDLDFFPEELQSILDPTKAKKRKARVAGDDLDRIGALFDEEGDEKDEKKGDKEGEGEGEEEAEINMEDEDEEDLVDDNDYAENYFDNGEGDDLDDDDGEGEIF